MQFCFPKKETNFVNGFRKQCKNKQISQILLGGSISHDSATSILGKYPRESCINVHQDIHQETQMDAPSGTNHSRVKLGSNVNVHEQEKG